MVEDVEENLRDIFNEEVRRESPDRHQPTSVVMPPEGSDELSPLVFRQLWNEVASPRSPPNYH